MYPPLLLMMHLHNKDLKSVLQILPETELDFLKLMLSNEQLALIAKELIGDDDPNSVFDDIYNYGKQFNVFKNQFLESNLNQVISDLKPKKLKTICKDVFNNNDQLNNLIKFILSSYLSYLKGKADKYPQTMDLLDLRHYSLNSEYLKTFSEVLDKNIKIDTLKLSYNDFTNKNNNESSSFAEIIKIINKENIRRLYLNNCNLGVEKLDDSILKNCNENGTLQLFDLSYNNLKASGASFLKKLLGKLKALNILSIEGNEIDDEEICSIIERIKNKNIIKLNILNNSVYEDLTVNKIIEFLHSHSSLKVLKFNCEKLSEKQCIAIKEAIKKNPQLRKLKIYYNNIEKEGEKILSTISLNNPNVFFINTNENYLLLKLSEENTQLKSLIINRDKYSTKKFDIVKEYVDDIKSISDRMEPNEKEFYSTNLTLDYIEKDTSIKTVEFKCNELTFEQCQSLIRIINNNPGIKIQVKCDIIDDKGLDNISALFALNNLDNKKTSDFPITINHAFNNKVIIAVEHLNKDNKEETSNFRTLLENKNEKYKKALSNVNYEESAFSKYPRFLNGIKNLLKKIGSKEKIEVQTSPSMLRKITTSSLSSSSGEGANSSFTMPTYL